MGSTQVCVTAGAEVWHQFCLCPCAAMDAFAMIARCASRQNPGDAPLRYELHTSVDDTCAARFVDLASALAMGKLLVGLGYKTVFVRDELAAPGQPELWVWQGRRMRSGRWRTRRRGGALRLLADGSQSNQSGQDEIDGDEVVQQAWEQEDQDAEQDGQDRAELGNADGHG
jgi:hypothetical protein